MKTNHFFLLFIIALLLSACADEIVPVPPKKIVFALCDFTGSTALSRKDLKKNIGDVLNAIPPNTTFIFNQIGDQIDRAFIKDSTLPFDSATSNNKRRLRIKYQKIADSLYDSSGSIKYTCLHQALQLLRKRMEYYQGDTSYKKIYVVILSDMLEDCLWEGTRINLQNNEYKKAIDAIEKTPPQPFRNSSNLEICILFSSGDIKHSTELMDFWQKYFKKMGYTKPVQMPGNLPVDYFKR